jgi:hypothetical protein
MVKRYNRILVAFHVVSDATTAILAFVLAYILRFETGLVPAPKGIPPFGQYVNVVPIIALLVPLAFHLQGLYRLRRGRSRVDDFFAVLVGSIVAVVLGIAGTLYVQTYFLGGEAKDRGCCRSGGGRHLVFIRIRRDRRFPGLAPGPGSQRRQGGSCRVSCHSAGFRERPGSLGPAGAGERLHSRLSPQPSHCNGAHHETDDCRDKAPPATRCGSNGGRWHRFPEWHVRERLRSFRGHRAPTHINLSDEINRAWALEVLQRPGELVHRLVQRRRRSSVRNHDAQRGRHRSLRQDRVQDSAETRYDMLAGASSRQHAHAALLIYLYLAQSWNVRRIICPLHRPAQGEDDGDRFVPLDLDFPRQQYLERH